MNRRLRLIYFFICIISFIIAAPLLLFYSMGYRYDYHTGQIWQTGSLFIKSQPKKAQVYIDNKLYNNLTPTLLKNLQPGSYQVRVEKMGYSSWIKELKIEAKLVTFAERINLFKENMPANYLVNEIQKCTNSSNQQKTICFTQSDINQYKISLIDLNSVDTQIIYNGNAELAYPQWSLNNEFVFLKRLTDNDYFIFNTIDSNSKAILLSELIKQNTEFNLQNIKKIHWDALHNNILYILQNNTIYSLNINNSELIKIFSFSNINDFLIDNNFVYYLTNSADGKMTLSMTSFGNGQKSELLLGDLDLSLNYQLTKANDQIIYLFDEDNQLLILIKKESLSIKINKFQRPVKGLQWSNDFRKLLFWNDFEIYYNDLENDDQELITRYSQKVKTAAWYPDYNYVVFSLIDSIKVIELDSRDQRNTTTLSKKGSHYLSFDSQGKRMFYLHNENFLVWQEIQ